MIRHIKKPMKPLWALCALVIIVIALLIQLARLAAPRIDYFHASIEQFASQQLNAQVSIGKISAKWPALTPEVMIDDLSIKTATGQSFLNIDHVSMQLDILLSLFHWAPVWRHVDANGLRLTISQGEKGGWSLGGLKPSQDSRSWRYRSPGALFLMARDVKLKNADITFEFYNHHQLVTEIPFIDIQNNGHFHRLTAQAAIGDESNFKFILEGVGDPSIAEQFFAKAHLTLNGFPVERLAQLFSQVTINTQNDSRAPNSQSSADLKLWFDFASPSRFLMNGHIELSNDEASDFARDNYLDIPFKADIAGDYGIVSGLAVGLRNIQVDRELSLSPTHILLHDNQLTVAVTELNIEELMEWGQQRFLSLSDEVDSNVSGEHKAKQSKLKEVIGTLSPQGDLHNLYLTLDLLNLPQLKIQANLDKVDTDVWANIPGFKQVSGYLEAGLNEGFVLLDAKKFSLFPDKIYSAPIFAQSAKGFVAWNFSLKQKEAKVYGYDLSMQGKYGNANGNFLLDLVWGRKKPEQYKRENHLNLQIGLQNSKAIYHRDLVPTVLPETLLDWMDTSIKGGNIENAGIFYRGGLKKKSDRSVQFFADINNGQLDYSSDWPALNGINGSLLIDNNQLYGVIDNANIYGDDNFKGQFSWNENSTDILKINASGRASSSSGLKYIQESWLSSKVGGIADQLSAEGSLTVDVDLDIPLNDSSSLAKHNILLDFDNSQLRFKELDLVFNEIDGALNYTTEKGFVSKNLSGVLFDNTFNLFVGENAEGESFSNADDTLTIKAIGQTDIKSIEEWIQQPVLSFFKGELAYDLNIKIPLETDSDTLPMLSIRSDLIGVNAELPAPFKKQGGDSMLFSFDMPLQNDIIDYQFTLGAYFSGHYRSTDASVRKSTKNKSGPDQPYAMTLAFSDTQAPDFIKLPEEGIKVFGQFSQFDVDAWLPFFRSYPREDSDSPSAMDLFFSADDLKFKDQGLNNFLLSGQREKQGWSFIVDSDDVLGGIYIDDDKQRPLIVDIDYLKWPPEQPASVLTEEVIVDEKPKIDPLATIDPSTLPPMDITINRLVYKNKPLGNWSLEIRPDSESLEVRNIYATAAGFSLMGEAENTGAFLRWQPAIGAIPLSTRFTGTIVGDDPKTLFEQWELPVVLQSEKTEVEIDLFWTGSPAFFSIESLKGTINTRHTNGVFTQEKTDNATDALRLFGLLNFDSWARRVRLDFSDVYKKGIVFDDLQGQLTFNDGMIEISKPLTMKGPSSTLILSGLIDYPLQTVDARLTATLPVGGNLTVVAALAGGLPAAAGVYLVSKLFEKQVAKVSSINYTINGSWENPIIKVDNVQDDSLGGTGSSAVNENAGS